MGSSCLKVTKYFLLLFNLLFFILGAVILGFGLWILIDKSSFISVLQTSSASLKVGAYILVAVGAITMLMGFLGCIGAVNEVRCLLGLYITFLLLLLLAQVAAGLLIYFQRDALKTEVSSIVQGVIRDYNPDRQSDKNIQEAWDYVQEQLFCCGWTGPKNWEENQILKNKTLTSYPCSCSYSNGSADLQTKSGFCGDVTAINGTVSVADWPVYRKGCKDNVQSWLQDNLGIILGVCVGVAVIELLGMVLAISLCKNVHREDYTKVPK
ncbi:CD82 antigen [Emydura macquarii macquarii]|uniref:CD82 antigen n=1 Tax=Emydura macquarii macquarii TaxID=1129001 RepID=UPI00352B6E91